jgi:hypothetical protein
MPTVLRSGPFRFFFYAGDRNEPPHIHVERGEGEAKFWLDPVRLERSHGIRGKDINRIQELVEEHLGELLEAWDEFFHH